MSIRDAKLVAAGNDSFKFAASGTLSTVLELAAQEVREDREIVRNEKVLQLANASIKIELDSEKIDQGMREAAEKAAAAMESAATQLTMGVASGAVQVAGGAQPTTFEWAGNDTFKFVTSEALTTVLELAAREAREGQHIVRDEKGLQLASESLKIELNNEKIDQGKREAEEKAEAAMESAVAQLTTGVVGGALQVATGAQPATVAASPAALSPAEMTLVVELYLAELNAPQDSVNEAEDNGHQEGDVDEESAAGSENETDTGEPSDAEAASPTVDVPAIDLL